jgi:hypothetical protein
MQAKRKWCSRLSKDNFKHKFYINRSMPTAFGRKHHSPPYSVFCDSL